MKRFLILLFSLFSIFTYGANSVNEAEVNKYIRQKLDRDKTITFTTKLNKTNNTLEGYSDEGVLCAITPLDKQPDMISLLQVKSTISEKNGKLKPVYEIRNNNNQLLVVINHKTNKIRIEDKTTGPLVVTNFDIKTLNGTREFYHDNGKLKISHSLKNGVPNGEFKGYYENGKLLVKATLVTGDFSGVVTEYNEDGSIAGTYDAKDFDLDDLAK